MSRHVATKNEADDDPIGLVDPREISPGPDEVDEPGPGPRADATPGPVEQPVDESPSRPAGEVEAGIGVVDPRSGLPGPDLGP